jgi:predicted transcriptional regulator YheO
VTRAASYPAVHEPRVARWSPVCEAVALLLGPYVEVVLHDTRRDRILAIWHAASGRKPGDPSLLGDLAGLEPSASGVYGPYEKLLADGRRLTSVSAMLPDDSAMLCINLDRSPFEQAASLLAGFAAPTAPRPESLFEQDWTERVHQIVGGFVRSAGRPVERLTRDERLAVLRELDEAGVFAVRRSVPMVARALKASRSTVYALLADLKTPAPDGPRRST